MFSVLAAVAAAGLRGGAESLVEPAAGVSKPVIRYNYMGSTLCLNLSHMYKPVIIYKYIRLNQSLYIMQCDNPSKIHVCL